MWEKIKAFFRTPTPLEQYQRGKACVDAELAKAAASGNSLIDKAAELYSLSGGESNSTILENAYDDGVQDRLYELGYKDPYE